MIEFRNTYARLPETFYQRVQFAGVRTPGLVKVNAGLAGELGIDAEWLASAEGVAVLAGNRVTEGSEPLAHLGAARRHPCHHESLAREPRPRCHAPGDGAQPETAAHRLRRPLFDPLAVAQHGPAEGVGDAGLAAGGRACAPDRRVEFHRGADDPRRRGGGGADRLQPDRVSRAARPVEGAGLCALERDCGDGLLSAGTR